MNFVCQMFFEVFFYKTREALKHLLSPMVFLNGASLIDLVKGVFFVLFGEMTKWQNAFIE